MPPFGLHPNPQAGVKALNFFGYINAFVIMLVIIIWSRALHARLRHALLCMPRRARTTYHTSTSKPLHLGATHRARTPGHICLDHV
jgi:hypothetical protein